jgi:hypothetical protein
MLSGDLVVLCVGVQVGAFSSNPAMSNTGGQTWSAFVTGGTGGDVATGLFWAQFNGTWSANPSVTIAAESGTQPASVVMHAFRPSSGAGTWDIETDFTNLNNGAAPNPLGTGSAVTLANTNNVTIAFWALANASTWSNLVDSSSRGWVVTGLAQYRNTSGTDLSFTFAHVLQSASGDSGTVTNDASTAAAYVSTMRAWFFVATVVGDDQSWIARSYTAETNRRIVRTIAY